MLSLLLLAVSTVSSVGRVSGSADLLRGVPILLYR